MSNLQDGLQQLEYQKLQLGGSLNAIAEHMRNCANIAEQFSQMIAHIPFNPNMPIPAFPVPQQLPQTPVMGDAKPAEKRKRGPNVKEKKPKDPNAPKRPPSAYLLFQNEVRKDMQAQFPEKPYHEVLTEISKRWSAMSEEEKSIYNQATANAKEKYNVNKAAYDATLVNGDGVPVTPSVAPITPMAKVVKSAAVVASSPSDTSAEEASESSSEGSGDEVEEEKPVPKKSKNAAGAAATPAGKAKPAVKEKKQKKTHG